MATFERFLCAVDGVAEAMGLGRVRLDAEELITCALRRSGGTAFRDESFLTPLRRLLDAYALESRLNIFGHHAARWDVLRCLSNLLRFEAEEERDGTVVSERIVRPIFITGLPRAGTTLLHSLLAEDAALLIPRCWQTIAPYPDRAGRDLRRQRVDKQLRMFQRLAPEMPALHSLSADAPQECTEITAQVFQSLRYEATHRVPSYQRWLDTSNHLTAYRFHKRFLQHLQHQQGGTCWVLKCPDHIHALGAIEAIYPDARLVFVHRDPLHVIASASKLTEVLRRPFTRQVDKVEIGQQVLARVAESTDTMMTQGRAKLDCTLHIQYGAFIRDPLATLDSFYRHFGLPFREPVRRAMAEHLMRARRLKNHHTLEEFGLDASHLCGRFEPYMKRFSVEHEVSGWKNLRGRASLAA